MTTVTTRSIPACSRPGAQASQPRRLTVVPAPAARAARPQGGAPVVALRLTARGRRLLRALAVLALVAVIAAAVLLVARPASAGTQRLPSQARYHVMLPGETLWGVAVQLDPGADPRDVIAELVDLNQLHSTAVQAGRRIALP